MPTYTTVILTNLSTGLPFTFEVTQEKLERFQHHTNMVKTGSAGKLGDLNKLTRAYELSMFPSFQTLLCIFFENGFTNELLIQILNEFGVNKFFIQKLLKDEQYISSIKPWFEGITSDAERATRTLGIVYDQTKSFYTIKT